MSPERQRQPAGGWKCKFPWCPNRYTDVVGGDNAFGKGRKNATCIPCMYAEQMVRHGQTIEQVEALPHLMEMFTDLLAKTGWTWQQHARQLPAHEDAIHSSHRRPAMRWPDPPPDYYPPSKGPIGCRGLLARLALILWVMALLAALWRIRRG